MLTLLLEAACRPTWRCPNLLFLLPPGAVELSERISRLPWPAVLRLQVHDESLTSASAVWNAMLGAWNQIKALPGWGAADEADSVPFPAFSLGTPTLAEPAAHTGPAEPHTYDTVPPVLGIAKPRRTLDAVRASRSLTDMGAVEGLLGCAVVHASSGFALARHGSAEQPFDVEIASAAAAQALRAQRLCASNLGLEAPVEDVMVAAGSRLFLLRTVARHPDVFVFALLDKQRTNLALARYKLMEVEKALD
jgi:predicted regulator of Ras-like GTPase activity (Roadblock/LC7/MglB family)